MRVLIFPVISSRFVAAAPSFNFNLTFIRNVLEKDPGAVFYLVLPTPTEGSGWQYDPAELPVIDRVHYVQVPMYRNQFDDLILMTRDFWELFNERFGSLYFDVILNERPALAPMLRRLASFHLVSKSRRVTVVNRAQIVMKKEWFGIADTDELLEVVGQVDATTIYQSPHQQAEAVRVARKYLKPAQLERMMGNGRVFPLGIDCADISARGLDVKHEKLTVNYSHKLFGGQKFIESLRVMDRTLAGGRDINLQIVTGSAEQKMEMMKAARPYRYITITGRANREQFLEEASKAHVFVSNSVYEDFSATVVEQMYLGLIPVLIRKPWSEYLVPDGYPYLFEDQLQANAMLRYVLDNYEAVRDEWIPQLRSKIENEFDLEPISMAMYQMLHEERALDFATTKPGPGILELVPQVWEALPDEFGIAEIAARVKEFSKVMDLDKELEGHSTSKWLFVDHLLDRYGEHMQDLGGRIVRWRKDV